MNMKIYAMYLPQFHRVPENDEWWGDGFTEWVSVKKAKALFHGHYQPHIPLHGNYYNLLEKETMEWQAELMHQYGIDGMCFYHYWFENGRKILEKPAENLLAWKDIDMPFCFYWANETWARSWSAIRGANAWADLEEKKGENNKEKAILLQQRYGDEEQWIEHFEYMLPFFKDKRYILVDGKPLFMIYKVKDIVCLDRMLRCWQGLAVKAGLNGLYVIGANYDSAVTSRVDAFLIHEPSQSMYRLMFDHSKDKVCTLDYSSVWEEILEGSIEERKTYYSGFVGFDDTPRRGKKGCAVYNTSPELFQRYLIQLMAKSRAAGNEMVFINAWNEWGEGMHLEPDEKNSMGYLNAVLKAREHYRNVKDIHFGNINNSKMIQLKKNCDKFEKYLNLFDEWISLKEEGKKVSDYLKFKGYEKVAIYGYGIFGRHLLHELQNDGVDVVCVVDKRKDRYSLNVPVYFPDDIATQIDCMIVTSYYYFNEIVREFGEVHYDIISFEQIIQELL